ncbi:OsmC family protein [Sphingobacterium sp. N143]|uniref:OsmC family protein n=1 Tax=Sphingobacterium sp. N143 TaxID=2746727 RepID=UPI0025782416|nr:OsmC family protein [Sphingobacterium sp. N143]MDM1295339.1 OsmC family protein [Sphingobacterium sp. N143]
MKYILENPIKGTIGVQKYKTVILWRNGILITDEPEKLNGKDLGPDPFTLLLSSLAGCTLATLRMYIDHKDLPISEIEVEANLFQKIEDKETVTYIERKIIFRELPNVELQQRLQRVAENCPISKILKGKIGILTELSTV